jgi:hypothetical protein
MGFRVNISAINLKERTFLYYIALNNSLTEDVLIFFFNEITLHTNIRDLIKKISTDYAFKKIKKIKKTRGNEILDLKR